MRRHLLTLFFILSCFTSYADGILVSWGGNNLAGMTQERFEDAKKWPTADILSKNLTVTTWPEVYLLLVAATQHKDDKLFISSLINQVANNTQTQLQLTSRLVIWERITQGDILFEGKGMQVDDDLYQVAGRANFILRNITNRNYGFVSIKSTAPELASLQTSWQNFSSGKPVKPYLNPFETKETGLTEIRSLIALEALITSLRPSAAKDSLTSKCLRTLYKLDKLPAERGAPASYCSPDTYTVAFLAILTGDKTYDEKKNYEWWKRWWQENKNQLTWNKDKGSFELKH